MQTFLPYRDFTESAKVLDYRRLGKQRVEAWQILQACIHLRARPNDRIPWGNHPAVKMWRGSEPLLAKYGIAMCEEWIRRGYKDTMLPRFQKLYASISNGPFYYHDPIWLGWKGLHESHRSNLVRKNPGVYQKIWPDADPSVPYFWPVK